MSIQNKLLGGLGAVAGAAIGIGAASGTSQSKQEQAAARARKAMNDELSMKLAQEQIKGQRLANRISRIKLRTLKKEVALDVNQKE